MRSHSSNVPDSGQMSCIAAGRVKLGVGKCSWKIDGVVSVGLLGTRSAIGDVTSSRDGVYCHKRATRHPRSGYSDNV